MSCLMVEVQMTLSRTPLISRQDAIFPLRSSLSHSKLLYLLHCTVHTLHQSLLLEHLDTVMCEDRIHILNIKFSDSQWL